MSGETPGWVRDLGDAELIRHYEAVRRLIPRPESAGIYRRELERRAAVAGSVDDPSSGLSYIWDDADESVVRREIAPAIVAARAAEMRRLRDLRQSLGFLALAGPTKAVGQEGQAGAVRRRKLG